MFRLFRFKTLCIILLFSAAGAVLCLLTNSYWLPWLVPHVGEQYGLVMASAERGEEGELILNQLSYDTQSLHLEVERVALPSVFNYLRERYAKEGFSTRSRVDVGQVTLALKDSEEAPNEEEWAVRFAPAAILSDIKAWLKVATPWLPPLRLDGLEVKNPNGGKLIALGGFRFAGGDGDFTVDHLQAAQSPALQLEGSLISGSSWTLAVHAKDWNASSYFELTEVEDAWILAAELQRAEDRIELEATLGPDAPMPTSAMLRSDAFTVPVKWFAAVESSARIGDVQISDLQMDWDGSSYSGSVLVSAAPEIKDAGAYPLTAEVWFSGDLQKMQLARARVESDWLKFKLSNPVELRFAEKMIDQPVELSLAANLDAQSWFDAVGQISGLVRLTPEEEGLPRAEFELRGKALRYEFYKIGQASASGSFESDVLTFDSMRLQPIGDHDEDRINLTGQINMGASRLNLAYELTDDNGDWLNALAGHQVFSGPQQLKGQVGGTFEQPEISGSLAIGVALPEIKPVRAEADFQADGLSRYSIQANVQTEGAKLMISSDAELLDDAVKLRIKKLRSEDAERPLLSLVEPVELIYNTTEGDLLIEERLRVGPFELRGDGLFFRIEWPEGEALKVSAHNLSSTRLAPWVDAPVPPFFIESVELVLKRFRPWLVGQFSLHANQSTMVPEEVIRIDLKSSFGPDGLAASQIDLGFGASKLSSGQFELPVRFQIPTAATASPWSWINSGRLSGSLNADTTQEFTDWLLQTTGVEVRELSLEAKFSGEPEAPVLNAKGQLKALAWQPKDKKVTYPKLQNLNFAVQANSKELKLSQLRAVLNDGLIEANFATPTAPLRKALEENTYTDWWWLSAASGELRLGKWKLEDWEALLPAVLRRSGQLDGELQIEPGFKLKGLLSFSDVALRPTPSLPSVDQIQGKLRLDSRILRFEDAGARIGGSPVAFSGKLDANDFDEPLWEFEIAGQNVPLVRTTDMILRSDLDLRIARSDHVDTPLLSGDLGLRSSTLLVEFDPLAPSVQSGPRQQPPFFAVTEAPFADWRFDLKLSGEKFMRVRSPYFKSLLSANFELGGTFGVPELIGSVRTTDAELRFPGAKMRLDNGEAFIEKSRPNEMQLAFTGIAKTGSYIVTMDISDTMANPHVEFQSTPSLPNAAIVRLLATGSTSAGGVGKVGLYLGSGLLGAGGMDESLADKLTVDVGQEISRSGKNTVGVTYELSDDWQLSGEYDKFDAYNLDLIWSLFKR